MVYFLFNSASFRIVYITLKTGLVDRNGRMELLLYFRRKTEVTQTICIFPEQRESDFKQVLSAGVIWLK
jgi:hypothetical protein